MKENPIISIIMPVKNREKLIKNAIKSVIKQTIKDWELIVVDDHSTDNTIESVKKFNDKRIKIFKLPIGTGPGPGRDYGIKQAEGEIIVLADSDDINYPNRLELIYRYLKNNPDVDIVYGRSITKKGGTLFNRPTCPHNPELLKKYNYISNPTSAFRKKAYLSTKGYDSKIKTSEDYDLWLAFLDKKCKFHFINKPLVLQIAHKGSTLAKHLFEKRLKNIAYVRKKHKLPVPRLQETKKLVPTNRLWKFITTPRGLEFWFNISESK